MTIGAWNSFKKSWKHQAAMQIATLGVLAGSFTVLSAALLVHQNMYQMLTHWGQGVKVNVYLREEIDENETNVISSYLNSNSLFSEVKLLSKKDAAEKFKQRVGQYVPGLLSDIEFDNPIPSSFEMVVSGGMSSGSKFDQLLKIVEEIKSKAGVDEVSYGQGWIENYASVLNVFSATSGVLIFTLLSGALFVIGNSIRNSISQRRDEIEVMELCGATRGMIMWPYIFEGLIMGLLAASLSIVVTYMLYSWQTQMVAGELSFWSFTAKIKFLSIGRISLILLLGAVLGSFGSFLWVRKISTGWAAAEANI